MGHPGIVRAHPSLHHPNEQRTLVGDPGVLRAEWGTHGIWVWQPLAFWGGCGYKGSIRYCFVRLAEVLVPCGNVHR